MHQSARLTGDLLARKGSARPTEPAHPVAFINDHHRLGGRRRALLGGHQTEPPVAARETPPAIAAGRSSALPAIAAREPVRGDRARRVALTLRLDHDRHTRLRILAARRERTSQDLLVEALDALLAAAGRDCACLRGRPET